MNNVWIIISVLLLSACNSTPEFTRIIDGKDETSPSSDGLFYGETILVKHTPKDTLEQIKMMIAYYDSVGTSLPELKKRGDFAVYYMDFVKDTRVTRKRYLKKEKLAYGREAEVKTNPNPNETYIGYIIVFQMDKKNEYITKVLSDSAKWKIEAFINLGNNPDAEYTGVNLRRYPLYDESDPDWWEHHKDSTMLQYDEPIWKYVCKDGRVINYFKKLQGDKLEGAKINSNQKSIK